MPFSDKKSCKFEDAKTPDDREVVDGEMVCDSDRCMYCSDGGFKETTKLWIL